MCAAIVHPSAVVDESAVLRNGTRLWQWVRVADGAVIGSNCSLGQKVHVGSRVQTGNNFIVRNNVTIDDKATLEEKVSCGLGAMIVDGALAIVCGLTIGRCALVEAGSVVDRDVPAYTHMAGTPARHIGWVSEHGERLELPVTGEGQAVCSLTGERYILENGVCRRLA
jgi:UDP-2-acetamido-3-amino-2,3-dideoxy-glucuronate N-acetyltransferase